jgi:hypothetical protein
MNVRFGLRAKSRRGEVPEMDDYMGWLFLMQHYRLPTRLLDWSQSPLVALYFATEGTGSNDALLWALRPAALNQLEAGEAGIYIPSNSELMRIGKQAFQETKDIATDTRILSVLTHEADPRHMVQQSAFTIHGRPDALNKIPEAGSFLARVRIPGTAKGSLRACLRALGISRATLFPDLENLALDLAMQTYHTKEAIEEIVEEQTLTP